MIEFQLIDDTEDVEVNLIDNTDNIEVELIKEIDSYNQLKDKPSINNVTLTGNKTLHELGIQQEGDYPTTTEFETRLAQKVDKVTGKGLSTNDYTTPEKNKLASLENYDDTEIRQLIDTKQPRGNYALKSEIPTKNSQLQNDSGFISQETDPTVPNHVKSITQNNIANWNNKQEQLISGTNIKTINNTSILGSGNIEIEGGGSDYEDLDNLPKINNVELKGNKTSSDLGLITNAVDDLVNYYKKSETFTKQEVNNLIAAITTLDIQVVQTLPTEDISTTTIYLVPKTTAEQNDAYDEYIYVSNAWEHIGSTEVDLTNYITNTDYASSSSAGIIRIGTAVSTYMSSDNRLSATTRSYADYTSGSDAMFIGKGTLENVITGKGLYSKPSGGIPKSDLTNDVQTSLGKADTALQSYTETDPTVPSHVKSITQSNITSWNNKADAGDIPTALSDLSDDSTHRLVTDTEKTTWNGKANVSDIPKIFYGSCATGASTAAKVVVCEEFTAADLVAGTRLVVHFTNGNSYNGQATLNVNSTGAKNIYYNGTTANARYMWVSGESVEFIYNGEQWATINGGLASTTYYGVTKLATTAGSDSQVYALTPRALFYFGNYSIAPYYSASSTYAVGDKVRYTYYIYECITAIETPEAWTAAHWQQIDTLQEQIDTKVSNTDYATPSVGGVLKVTNGDYGITVDEGVLKGTVRTLAQYNSMSSKGLVCKGTLENVLDDRIGDIDTILTRLTTGSGV